MSREDVLEFAMNIVNSNLAEFFNALYNEVYEEAPKAADLVTVSRDYTLRGGKRLRALLVLVGYWSGEWGNGDRRIVASVMTAIELLQSYLLIHDDIMDRDEMRRGGPTVHVWFSRMCRERGWRDCEHYGVSQAITTGDLLEASAVGLLALHELAPRILKDLIYTYAKGLRKVAYGQFLDVMFSQLPLSGIGEEDVILVYKLKTSSYTVELPLHLGAIISSKYNSALLKELSSYAIPAGIAFQIRDDIIGLYGDPATTGKPAGSDVKSKKKTILVVKAHELAGSSDRQLLEEVYDKLGEHEISDYHVEAVRRIVKETGGLQYAEELISKYVDMANEAL
ncbi:MAG: polyprenyl synthetase family protein, partial [Desulfurococcaceae archaeon]